VRCAYLHVFLTMCPSLDNVSEPLPPSAPSAASSSSSIDGGLTLEESMVSSNLTSTMSTHDGASSTTIGTASRSGRLPPFAHGFVQLYPSFSSVRMSRHWILNDLFVAPTVRNRGIGALLLTHVKKVAQETGAQSMELSTATSNLAAQKLYASLDWRKDQDHVVFNMKM
jgi:hypothetical protein